MKALVMKEYNRLVFEDVPDPVCGGDEVIVRVKACGICGSDVHGFDGSTGRRIPPIVMGHEASGVIVETGKNISSFKTGDRVTFDSTIYCGKCPSCRAGMINLCENRRVLGVSCDEYRRDGAFADYVAIPEHILYRLPDTLSFDRAALVEPLSIAFHAVGLSRPPIGSSAVVIGTGVIGLFAVAVLKTAGCGVIIAVDTDAERRASAKEMGADVVIDPAVTDACGDIVRLTGGGADMAFEAVGIPATIALAAECIKKGGKAIFIGNLVSKAEIPLQKVVARQLSILGSCASNGEYPACLDLIARNAVATDSIISARAPLADGEQWFKRLYNHESGLLKVILEP